MFADGCFLFLFLRASIHALASSMEMLCRLPLPRHLTFGPVQRLRLHELWVAIASQETLKGELVLARTMPAIDPACTRDPWLLRV